MATESDQMAPPPQADARASRETADRALQIAEQTQRRVAALDVEFRHLRQLAPPVAVKRQRHIRLACEIAGVTVAAVGTWWIYPPASLILIGVWLFSDVVVARRAKKGHAN